MRYKPKCNPGGLDQDNHPGLLERVGRGSSLVAAAPPSAMPRSTWTICPRIGTIAGYEHRGARGGQGAGFAALALQVGSGDGDDCECDRKDRVRASDRFHQGLFLAGAGAHAGILVLLRVNCKGGSRLAKARSYARPMMAIQGRRRLSTLFGSTTLARRTGPKAQLVR